VNVYIRAEAVGAGSFTAVLLVKDGTTGATLCTSGTLTFSSTWTTQSILNCDLTGAATGDPLDYRIQSVTNAGTNYNVASIEMQPLNVDQLGALKVVDSSGAGITTGPTSVTSGHLATFNGTTGKIQDGGAAAPANSTIMNTCGTTTTCANTAQTAPRIVWGTVALSSGTPSTAVVSSMTAFTGTTSFACVANDLTTPANGVSVANTSTSSITITGPNTVTDTVKYICTGN